MKLLTHGGLKNPRFRQAFQHLQDRGITLPEQYSLALWREAKSHLRTASLHLKQSHGPFWKHLDDGTPIDIRDSSSSIYDLAFKKMGVDMPKSIQVKSKLMLTRGVGSPNEVVETINYFFNTMISFLRETCRAA